MICEKCNGKMNWSAEGATQGWRCPVCGRNISDETEYGLCTKNVTEVDTEKIKFVSRHVVII